MLQVIAKSAFAALTMLAGAVFLLVAYTGYHSWLQGPVAGGTTLEIWLAAVSGFLFFSGIAPLGATIYFLIHLKHPLHNLLGLACIPLILFLHFIASVFSAHSSIYLAYWIGCAELVVISGILCIFHWGIGGNDDGA